MVTLNIKADTENTAEAMDFVEEELLRCNFPADLHPEILIAVEEIFVNIASYAYKPEEKGDLRISVTINKKAIIQFEDSGQPFNPLETTTPELNASIMEREIGGLGIHFVKNMMDEVEYRYDGGKNIFTIIKNTTKQDKVN